VDPDAIDSREMHPEFWNPDLPAPLVATVQPGEVGPFAHSLCFGFEAPCSLSERVEGSYA
jgi:hypothetical protein